MKPDISRTILGIGPIPDRYRTPDESGRLKKDPDIIRIRVNNGVIFMVSKTLVFTLDLFDAITTFPFNPCV